VTIGALLCFGCASKSKLADAPAAPGTEAPEEPLGLAEPEVIMMDEEQQQDERSGEGEAKQETAKGGIREDPCDQEDTEGFLDGTQEWIYQATCRTAAWFDGFFGNARYDERTGETFGRVGVSGFWDQLDGFDPSLRFRATFALPSVRDRASLMIGRGDEEEFVEERSTKYDAIPGNFNTIEQESFLVGLGFTGDKRKGFKLSIGARVRLPPEPYIKLRYRKHFALTESTLFSVRPIVYWQTEEKLGSTLHLSLDQMLTERLMLRWSNYGNVAQGEDVQGLEWESSLFLFQALSNRRAMTYRALIVGETKAEVPLNNYGFELRYRQRVLREWLFLELVGGVTWPQYTLDQPRDVNFGIGAGFEMYFGPVPEDRMY